MDHAKDYADKSKRMSAGDNSNRSNISGDTLARSNAGDMNDQIMPQFGNVRTERVTIQNNSM